ncbi:MAG: exo-alpha-sialidase [Lentisphaeria bacterium]
MKKILTTFLIFISMLSAVTNEIVLVEDGKTSSEAICQGDSWKVSENYITGNGTGQFLLSVFGLNNAPFTITAELEIEKLGHTAAGFTLGNALFGFDSPKGFFTEGTGLSQNTYPTNGLIKSAEKFIFTADYQSGKIKFSINGNEVVTTDFKFNTLASIGIRPHRAKVKVYNLKVKGFFKEQEKLDYVFSSGSFGYNTFRIPALVTSKQGTLLAFAEGRVNHSGDHGDLDIVLRRSEDDGKSWQDLIVVQDDGKYQCGNPAPIVDTKSGRIFLLSCGSTDSEHAVMSGKATREVYIQHSDDDGKSWTARRNISHMVRKENWRWYATGPCSGIQIQEGKHKGRLVVPANHSDEKRAYYSHTIFSDDNGETWQIGEVAGIGSNESTLAESQKDELYHSMRMQNHGQRVRGTRYSSDGGKSWTELKHDSFLNCSVCQAAVIRDYNHPSRLIFSNPAKLGKREGMAIRISEDGGRTWPYRKTVFEGSSAYSDLAMINKEQVGILFEGGNHSYWQGGIAFKKYSISELKVLDPAESQIADAKFGWGLWKQRHEQFSASAKAGDVDLVLLGDSITHYWQKNSMCKTDGQKVWDEYWANKKVVNMGIGSDRTQHVLYRVQNGNFDGIKPKAVVLMIGTNNTSSNHPAGDIYFGIRDIITEIHKRSANTKILLYDIFPRIRGGKHAQDNNARANELIKSLCDGKRVFHCSINEKLLDESGEPCKEIFFDGIHINGDGYKIWAEDILTNLKKANINL